MSYCLKTGGLLLDEANLCTYECDLHIEGNCVIAYTAGEENFNFNETDPRIQLVMMAHAEPFLRSGRPYGVIVVKQEDCRATPALQAHINNWYAGHVLGFDR